MSIFAISDLHLSFSTNKPMDKFGKKWENYYERLKENWNNTVKEEDLVIIPGDISWATYLDECYLDFDYINKLSGRKVFLKGNHDYWWTTLSKMKKFAYENKFDTISFIQNNSVQYENYSICGTRGWSIKSSEDPKLNEKIFDREKKRLILSLEDAKKKSSNEIIAALHYPPVEKDSQNKDFIDILNEYGVKICFYGHIHAQSIKNAVTGDFGGIELRLVSCDSVGFTPVLLK